MIESYKYFAFISYKREDEEWAEWLQNKLEYYKLPVYIKDEIPDAPDYIRPIFRDVTDLELGLLAENIKSALADSKFLIVICSPNATKSKWVNDEIKEFINLGKSANIIPFVVDGIANAKNLDEECFPQALKSINNCDELLGANIKELSKDYAAVKVISKMLGVRIDKLWQRYLITEEEEKQRLLAEKRKLQRVESRYLSEKADELIKNGNSHLAQLLLLEALPENVEDKNDRPFISEAEAVLREAQLYDTTVIDVKEFGCNYIDRGAYSSDEKFIIAGNNQSIVVFEAESGAFYEKLNFLNDEEYRNALNKYGIIKLIGGLHDREEISGRIISQVTNSSIAKLVAEEHCIVLPDGYKERSFIKCFELSVDKKLAVSSGTDDTMRIWDVEKEKCIRVYKPGDTINFATFKSDGHTILSGSKNGIVRLWSVTKKEDDYRKFDGIAACISTFGKYFINVSKHGFIEIRDTDSGKFIKSIGGHSNKVSDVVFSPDGKFIFSVGWDGVINKWNVETKNIEQTIQTHFCRNYNLSFDSTGEMFVLGSDEELTLYRTSDCDSFILDKDQCSAIQLPVLSNDNTMIVYTSSPLHDENILIKKPGEEPKVILAHSGAITSISSFSSNDEFYFTSSKDGYIKMWSSFTNECIKQFKCDDKVYCVKLSSDDKTIVSADGTGKIRIWDVCTGNCLKEWEGHTVASAKIALSKDNRLIASGDYRGFVRVWNKKGECIYTFIGDVEINSLDFSPDGNLLVAAIGGDIRMWDMSSGECVMRVEESDRTCYNVIFSPDDKTFLTISSSMRRKQSPRVRIWDTLTWECKKEINLGISWDTTNYTASYSSDGNFIVVGVYPEIMLASGGKTVRGSMHLFSSYKVLVYNTETGKCINTFDGFIADSNNLLIGPGRKAIALNSMGGIGVLADIFTGKNICNDILGDESLRKGKISSINFSPNGNMLAITYLDKNIVLHYGVLKNGSVLNY